MSEDFFFASRGTADVDQLSGEVRKFVPSDVFKNRLFESFDIHDPSSFTCRSVFCESITFRKARFCKAGLGELRCPVVPFRSALVGMGYLEEQLLSKSARTDL